MRLIDADLLIKYIPPEEYGAIFAVNNCPTAYDVDKVCEELDSAEYPFYLYDVDGCDVDESLLKADMVESIVRRGGINE